VKYPIITICFLFLFVSGQGQNLDSLLGVWNNSKNDDSVRVEAIHTIAWRMAFSNPDSSIALATLELKFTETIEDENMQVSALNTIGVASTLKGSYIDALGAYNQAITVAKKNLNNSDTNKVILAKRGMAQTYINRGILYKNQGDYPNALDNQLKSLSIWEELGVKENVATAYGNIGIIYKYLKEYDKALDFQMKSVDIRDELGDFKGQSSAFSNIGTLYNILKKYDKALEYHMMSLELSQELNDRKGVSTSYGNIGNLYSDIGKYDKAIEFQEISLALAIEMGNKKSIASSYVNLGEYYIKLKNYTKAIEYLNQSLEIATSIGVLKEQKFARERLVNAYREKGNFEKALENYEYYILLRDSMLNENTSKEITRSEIKFEFEKENLKDSLRREQEKKIQMMDQHRKDELKEVEIVQQKNYLFFAILGMMLMLLLVIVFYRNFKQKKRDNIVIVSQKNEVENQKAVIEIKSKEILSSIAYAKRIQNAILPSEDRMKDLLGDYFVLYKPKDIVAGDFYWVEEVNGSILFAAADCTGHGVPGAMVSVVCSNALNRVVHEDKLSNPGNILDKATELVIEQFEISKTETVVNLPEETIKDGMDLALCCIKGRKLSYAGANNPLWIIRDGGLIEVKGTKQPVGNFPYHLPFENHEFDLLKGDTVYVFSDGYVDQFGGGKGKKYKSKAFKELLLSIQSQSMEHQKVSIDTAFENWRGDLEQIDDVCVIGIKI